MNKFQLIFKSIGIYGLSQAIASISALIRFPIAINYLGISDFGKMVSMVQIFSIPFLLQGALRLHFRKQFASAYFNIKPLYLDNYRQLFKFGIHKFKWLILICFGLILLLANRNFAGDLQLKVITILIMFLIFISIIPNSIQYGYLDSQGKHNSVIAIDIFSSFLSIPALIFTIYLKMQIAIILLVFTSTFWMPILVLAFMAGRNQLTGNSLQDFKREFHYISYLKQSLGSSLTLNFNSLIFAIQTNPILAAKINIAEKLISAIFIPSAALAPHQFVMLARESNREKQIRKKVQLNVIMLNITLTILIGVAVLLISKFISPILLNDSEGLSWILLATVAFSYFTFSIFSTLQLINMASQKPLNWALNLSVAIGLISFILCFAFAPLAGQFTLLISIGIIYLLVSTFTIFYFLSRH
jgi:O-antigen/teichoic acid export membrane protein